MRPHLRTALVALILVALFFTHVPEPPASAAGRDYPIENGHFYSQAANADEAGFTIVDDPQVRFWSEFQRLGGVDTLGYPISQRFTWHGFTVQAMQKVVLQWRPEVGQAYAVNILDLLHEAGQDGYLQTVRQTPPPKDWADEGLPWPVVVERHQAVLQGWPAIAAVYRSAPGDPLLLYGLPTSDVIDMGNNFALRAQRVVFQQWKEATPWAAAGQVTVANGGDLAKETGLLPEAALHPVAAPPEVPLATRPLAPPVLPPASPIGRELRGIAEIEAGVAAARGLPFRSPVDKRLLTPEQLAQRFARQFEQPEVQEAVRYETLLWTLLGLLPESSNLSATYVDLYASQIIGLYVPREKRLYVRDDGTSRITPAVELTLAHELVHALHDQYFDLASFLRNDAVGSSDESAARRALVEGDAVVAQSLYAQRRFTAEQIEALNATAADERSSVSRVPLILQEQLFFPYTDGSEFVAALYQRGGWFAVNEAWRRPPVSAAQVLHIDRYLARRQPLRPDLPELAPRLGPDWQEIERDSFGEVIVRTMVRQFLGLEAASVAADGWAGDNFVLLANNGMGALAGRLEFDNPTEATQFTQAYVRATATRFGNSVAIQRNAGQTLFLGQPAVLIEQRGRSVILAFAPTGQQTQLMAAQFGS